MAHLVILGNSIAGMKTAEEVSAADPSMDVSVFLFSEPRIYSRRLLGPFWGQEIPAERFFLTGVPGSGEPPFRLLTEERVERINFKKRQLFLNSKERMSYDFLVLADTGLTAMPKLKGIQRNGVFAFRRASDLEAMPPFLPMAETVVIDAKTLRGFHAADAFRRRNKEVLLLFPADAMVPSRLDAESWGRLSRTASDLGIRIIENNAVTEILGDNDVKAVRLKSGKVLGCQVVVFPDAPLDLKILKDTAWATGEGVPTNAFLETSEAGVFAVDGMCRYDNGGWPVELYGVFEFMMQQQGTIVAQRIMGREPCPFALPEWDVSGAVPAGLIPEAAPPEVPPKATEVGVPGGEAATPAMDVPADEQPAATGDAPLP